ncbi:myosin-9 isoform X3 [Manduca sexta]|uniref:DUF4795 domain-containing protein n=1 Tax=Manduca sexta TaxID=7130 RepID=A0A922CI30_MANSE|nr:myosin-9 isoform X3 [Manduca sexta]KAG6446417.1 hypothetical protein O3G_MSEX004458 [Manduca sexta]KAG6446418.1 hypothetical protein O3G_MSEX004458 [Manduca sexta]
MSSSNTSIMSIGEMIDTAFGDTDVNIVNHKLLQTILFLLARQLRVLERRVKLEMGTGLPISSSSSLSVTEVKLHAMQKKKTKGSRKEGKHAKSAHEPVSSSDKTSSERSKDKSSSTKSTTDRTTTETTTSTGKSSSDKTSTDKSSSAKSTDKSTTEKSSTLTSTDKSASDKDKTTKKSRAQSREVGERTPTPMASLDSVEAQYEKLLIVERVPTKDGQAKSGKRSSGTPRLSVVTQEQFAELAATVQELMAKFKPIGLPSFPENIELMQELRKNASLADAMAALQLAARLEAAEKTLNQMLLLVTELAKKTGIELTGSENDIETQLLLGIRGPTDKPLASPKSKKGAHPSQELIEIPVLPSPPPVVEPSPEILPSDKPSQLIDFVTYEELDSAMQELYDEIKKTITGITTRSTANADNAFKIATRMEQKLEASLNLGSRMDDLEILVSEYADQITALDTGLSSQMTNYQEQLTQMQHDLETGLENMAEQLANAGSDTTAVAELNGHFTNLQQDLDNSLISQKELKDNQQALSHDLEDLWKQIEKLRETKSDREEVTDALRDKAGIGALNGLVSLQQFDAVRGDFEKRIGAAYDKFNNQEILWQKAIDDLLRELNDKADLIQLVSLQNEITKYLDMLKSRMHAMFEIVGEPRAAAITRKLHRDAACLSCATPAWMDVEENRTVPALPAMQATRPPTIGAEASKPKEDGDHGLCYPGYPLPHPRHIKSHVCQRYCGGSHTLINNTISRSPPGMIISPLRQPSTGLGTDRKMNKIDESKTKIPCLPCNEHILATPEPSEAAQVPEHPETSSNMTPSDFRPMEDFRPPSMEQISVTPPPPLDEDF